MTALRTLAARLIAYLIFRGPVTIGFGRTAYKFIFDPRRGTILPLAAGADDGDDDSGSDDGGDDDSGGDGGGDDDGGSDDDSGDDDKGGADDVAKLRAELRKHRQTERRAKDAEKRAKELEARLKKIEDEGKSEQDKALAKAREEATAEVTTKFQAEQRQDRLELATTRLATKGVKVGDETIKFADPDDALAHLERAIKRGDVDGDDIFGENGKVDNDALSTALAELLEDKPHLRAGNGSGNGGGRRAAGDADAGKGKASKALEEMKPEDHLKAIQKR